jgi:hypothetical protein
MTDPAPSPVTPDPPDPDGSASRDPDAAGGVPLEELSDALPPANVPEDGGMSADDISGEAPD